MTHIGEPLGVDLVQAASGIRKIANVAMARAIRSVTVERGRDARDMGLMAFGGGGPVHAVEVAGLLGIREVIVPAMSGVFCSVGMLASDVEHNFVRSLLGPLGKLDPAAFSAAVEGLRADGEARLRTDGFPDERIALTYAADLRYLGQSSELTVPFDPDVVLKSGFDVLETAFMASYNDTFGYTNDEPAELVNIRLAARGIRENRLTFEGVEKHVVALDIPDGERSVWFPSVGDYTTIPTRARTVVSNGPVTGPAILEAYDTTVVLPPGAVATSDGCGSLVISVPDSVMES
jgi:N-methylhydantoinase A